MSEQTNRAKNSTGNKRGRKGNIEYRRFAEIFSAISGSAISGKFPDIRVYKAIFEKTGVTLIHRLTDRKVDGIGFVYLDKHEAEAIINEGETDFLKMHESIRNLLANGGRSLYDAAEKAAALIIKWNTLDPCSDCGTKYRDYLAVHRQNACIVTDKPEVDNARVKIICTAIYCSIISPPEPVCLSEFLSTHPLPDALRRKSDVPEDHNVVFIKSDKNKNANLVLRSWLDENSFRYGGKVITVSAEESDFGKASEDLEHAIDHSQNGYLPTAITVDTFAEDDEAAWERLFGILKSVPSHCDIFVFTKYNPGYFLYELSGIRSSEAEQSEAFFGYYTFDETAWSRTKKYDSEKDFERVRIEYFRRVCGKIPFPDPRRKDQLDTEYFFVAPKFANRSNRSITFGELIGKLCCARKDIGLSFITGRCGSGKSTVLKAITLCYADSVDNSDCSWAGIDAHFPEDVVPFYMDIAGTTVSDNGENFMGYIQNCIYLSGKAQSDSLANEAINLRKKAYYDYLCNRLRSDKRVVFLINAPETLDETKFKNFFTALESFLAENPNASAICTLSESARREHFSGKNYDFFEICPPSIDDYDRYVQKWVTRFYPNKISAKKKEYLTAVHTNSVLRSAILTTPAAVILYFLSVENDDSRTPFNSQPHLLRSMAAAAAASVTSAADTHKDKYDFVIPLCLLALRCCECKIAPTLKFTASDIGKLIDDENSPVYTHMSAYLTDDAKKAIDNKNFVHIFTSKLSKYLFVSYNGTTFFFDEAIRDYYAAVAISRGLVGTPSDSYDERINSYVSGVLTSLCKAGEIGDELAEMWISILSTATKLSRAPGTVVGILKEFAGDFSPRNRLGREIAVSIMVKLIRNRTFINDPLRKDMIFSSLSFYLYHRQLDDIDAILATSPYRESFLRTIFDSFAGSVSNSPMHSIPMYHFVIGYIFLRYIDIGNQWDDLRRSDSISDTFTAYVLQNTADNRNFLAENIKYLRDICDKEFGSGATDRHSKLFRLMLVLAVNDMTWLWTVSRVSISQIQSSKIFLDDSVFTDKIRHDYAAFLGGCIKSEDYYISNAACYALSHLTAEYDDEKNHSGKAFLQYVPYKNVLLADYRARLACDSLAENGSIDDSTTQPYCGALRLMVTLQPGYRDIAGKMGKVNADIREYYRALWYSCLEQTRSESEATKSHYLRYLMLIFKPCLFAGSFNESELKEAICLLWKLKFPDRDILDTSVTSACCGNTLGLKYDREDKFIKYIQGIYREISKLPDDPPTHIMGEKA